jgi:hypothetical protein
MCLTALPCVLFVTLCAVFKVCLSPACASGSVIVASRRTSVNQKFLPDTFKEAPPGYYQEVLLQNQTVVEAKDVYRSSYELRIDQE